MVSALHEVTVHQPVPERYHALTEQQFDERIRAVKEQLGERLLILGHHYQRDEVYRHADLTGDSFQLSKMASEKSEAEYIVFCGVHFMAESADILSQPHQKVVLPDLAAGCSMADMANDDQVERAWDELMDSIGECVLPITYMNSSASLKAFVGRHGGAVCTSSNARPLLEWALSQKEKVLFFPDQHLGRNTGYRMGIPLEEMVVWNPFEEMGGLQAEQLQRAKLLLWKGHCSVHMGFHPRAVDQMRAEYPGIRIIVHPECSFEVFIKADDAGSTGYIMKTIRNAPAGSTWAIGTEVNLVNRLAKEQPDKRVMLLGPDMCMCSTMFRIAPQNLLWSLESLAGGHVVNQIKVDPETARDAKLALDRMLAIA